MIAAALGSILMVAMSVVQALPVLVFTFLIQRHLVDELTIGGVER